MLGAHTGAAVVLAVTAAGTGVGGADSAQARPAAAVPATPRLPAGIEPLAPYQPQEICWPADQPGVRQFRRMVLRTYPGTASGGSLRSCGAGGRSEHKDGRAWDWIVDAHNPRERAQADAFLRWLLKADARGRTAANARRLGIMYIVWNGRIWRSYDAGRGWAPYAGGDGHGGHVHFSFSWAGASGQTSFYSRSVAPPVVAPRLPMFGRGSKGTAVRDLQRLLRVRKANGVFGEQTRRAVRRFQRTNDIRASGLVTRRTWAALLPPATPVPRPSSLAIAGGRVLRPGARGSAVVALQRLLGVRRDGSFGPATAAAVRRFQARHRLATDVVVGPRTWRQLRIAYARAHPPVLRSPLRVGSRGQAVRIVQRRLHVRADGVYGPATARAVRAYQQRAHLKADGVVGARTWRSLT